MTSTIEHETEAVLAADAEGIKSLDGTPAEAAIERILALETSIANLKTLREEDVLIVKAVLGDAVTGTIKGAPVVHFRWRNKTTVATAALRAYSESLFSRFSKTNRERVFTTKVGR